MTNEIENKLTPKLSIIIPCYNCQETIKDTLDSIKNNNTRCFEVLMINDGSNDNTERIIAEYCSNTDMDITLVTQENSGVSSARNNGIRLSKGEYIIFLDSDDLFAFGYIDLICSLVSCDTYDAIACHRTQKKEYLFSLTNGNELTKECSALSLLSQYTYSKKELSICSFVYKTKIIKQNSLSFTIGSKYGEDFEFVTKYLSFCNNALEIKNNLFYYRILNTSVSRTIDYCQTDAIHSAIRTEHFLQEANHPFYREFEEFMVSKTIFSCAHRFCSAKRKDLFFQLILEFDVKFAMKSLLKNKKTDLYTKIGAISYLIDKKLFYYLCVLLG